ncbi:hypothetical protein VTO73DRAFT_12340 [Trametes versicolor]
MLGTYWFVDEGHPRPAYMHSLSVRIQLSMALQVSRTFGWTSSPYNPPSTVSDGRPECVRVPLTHNPQKHTVPRSGPPTFSYTRR